MWNAELTLAHLDFLYVFNKDITGLWVSFKFFPTVLIVMHHSYVVHAQILVAIFSSNSQQESK